MVGNKKRQPPQTAACEAVEGWSDPCHPDDFPKTPKRGSRFGEFKEKTSRGRLQLQRISNDTKDQRGTAFGNSLLICFMALGASISADSQSQTEKKKTKH